MTHATVRRLMKTSIRAPFSGAVILILCLMTAGQAQTSIQSRFASAGDVTLHYLMVAYAYAAQYPTEVDRIVLMDAFLPGVGDWKSVWLLRDLWHFHFYGVTPLKLVAGRERIYFEHFWNDFAADPKHSIPEIDRRFYAAAYAQPGAMRAGFEVFRAFEKDAKDFADLAQTKLTMPMLVLTGEKASGNFLIEQARLVDSNVNGVVIKGSGHWLMDEAPTEVIPRLVGFINTTTN